MLKQARLFVSAAECIRRFGEDHDARIDDFNPVQTLQLVKAINKQEKLELNCATGSAAREALKSHLLENRKNNYKSDFTAILNKDVLYVKTDSLLSRTGKLNSIYHMLKPPSSSYIETSSEKRVNISPVLKSKAIAKKAAGLTGVLTESASSKPGFDMDDFMSKMSTMMTSKLNDQSSTFQESLDERLNHFEETIDTKITGQIERQVAETVETMVDAKIDEILEEKIGDKYANLVGAFDELKESHAALEAKQAFFEDEMSAKFLKMNDLATSAHSKISANKTNILKGLNTAYKSIHENTNAKPTSIDIARELVNFRKLGAEYRSELWNASRGGMVNINLVDEDLYSETSETDENGVENRVTTPKISEINTLLNAKIEVIGEIKIGAKSGSPFFNAKITGPLGRSTRWTNNSDIQKMTTALLMRRRDFAGILGIRINTVSFGGIKPLIDEMINSELIVESDATKTGKLVLVVNDGLATIDAANREEYKKTCTFYMPESPIALANLKNPSIAKLRALARRTHFVMPTFGTLQKYPENSKETKYSSKKISEDWEGDDEDLGELQDLVNEAANLFEVEKQSSVWDD